MIKFKETKSMSESVRALELFLVTAQGEMAKRDQSVNCDIGNVCCPERDGAIVYLAVYPLSHCENCMLSAIMCGFMPCDASCAGCTGESNQ